MLNENSRIPKVIHYCWFGNNKKNKKIEICIKSWKNILKDYEIIEWNEKNFDINHNKYIQQAYSSKKFAFVSDYVRAFALYNYGGIYLDTDVQVFKKFDDLLENDSFWGFEEGNYIATSVIGAKKKNKLIEQLLDSYENKTFIEEDGSLNQVTNVETITNILEKYGLKKDGKYQKIEKMATFFPKVYFSPYDYINCTYEITSNSYCVHHFHVSWMPINIRLRKYIKKYLVKIIGKNNLIKIRKKIRKE